MYDDKVFTNKKLRFDVSVDEQLQIILNDVIIAESRQILFEERDAIASRYNIYYPKPNINFDKLQKHNKFNFVKSNIIESSNKNTNRTKTILPLEVEKYINEKAFPNKIVFSH